MPHSNLDYESPRRPIHSEGLGLAACVIGAAATLIPILSLSEMLTVPKGALIRPMGQALAMLLGAGTGVVIVLPMALVSIGISLYRRRSVRWGVWALLAAALSIFATPMTFLAILRLRGLVLAD